MVKVSIHQEDYITQTTTVGGFLSGKRTSVTVYHIPSRLTATCCEHDGIYRNRIACVTAIEKVLDERERRGRVCW